jgi:hypothetical protein
MMIMMRETYTPLFPKEQISIIYTIPQSGGDCQALARSLTAATILRFLPADELIYTDADASEQTEA